MFRGKNDMLPTTGERSRAPHISTVQIPKVSTPTILTYVWLGVSLLVLVLGIIFCSHSPDRRWAGCLTCSEDNAPDEKTHWGRGDGGALCLRVRMRARGWRAIPRAGDTAGGRPVGCASPTRAVSRDERTRCRTCEVTETRARAPPPADVTCGRNKTKTKPHDGNTSAPMFRTIICDNAMCDVSIRGDGIEPYSLQLPKDKIGGCKARRRRSLLLFGPRLPSG